MVNDSRSAGWGVASGAVEGDDGDTVAAALAPGLAQLVALARTAHVTRAALEVGTSQPTLSRAVRRWETVVGVDLVHRHGRGLSLTEAGVTMAAAAATALDELAEAARGVREDAGLSRGRVRFAFLHTMGVDVVPRLLAELGRQHPGITVALQQNAHERMLAALRAGDVDAVLTSPAPRSPDLAVTVLDTQPLVLTVAAGHHLAGRQRVRLTEVADEPWVVLAHGYGLRTITEGLWAGSGIEPQVAFEGQEAATLRGLAAAGLGVALLPEERVGPEVVQLPLDPPAHREITLVTTGEPSRSASVRALLAVATDFRGRLFT
ncbi:MAG: LysR family transcriptional regulator [Mycobacteriaceae bacterium]